LRPCLHQDAEVDVRKYFDRVAMTLLPMPSRSRRFEGWPSHESDVIPILLPRKEMVSIEVDFYGRSEWTSSALRVKALVG